MKAVFTNPEVTVLRMADSDIICTSGGSSVSCGGGGGTFETGKDSLFG